MTFAIAALITWGAGAFGAVYPWAHVPMMTGAAIVGLIGLFGTHVQEPPSRALTISLVAIGSAVLLQMVPLPKGVLRSVSPETDQLLTQYSLTYATSPNPHPISIDPTRTAVGAYFFGCLALFLIGASRYLTKHGPEDLATAVVAIGIVVALVGIVQKAIPTGGRIYGFWTPQFHGDIFGPFVNKDHFAGWMLMAVPLALGSFCGRVAEASRNVKAGWRNRVAWWSTNEAGTLVLVLAAAMLMMLSLLLTLSRSGIIAMGAMVVVLVAMILTRQTQASRRFLAVIGIVAVASMALGWTGVDRLAGQFSGVSNSAPARIGIWRDAVHIAALFPVAGIGLNTFGVATILYQTVAIDVHFTSAHNDYLQLLAEGGALVSVPVIIGLIFFAREVWRNARSGRETIRESWVRTGAVLGIIAIGFQELVDFSLQIPGNALLFTVLCAIAIHHPREMKSVRRVGFERRARVWRRKESGHDDVCETASR